MQNSRELPIFAAEKEEEGFEYDNITEHNRRNCHRTGIRSDEQAGAGEEALEAKEKVSSEKRR